MKMENPGKWTGATDARITKEIKDVEDRIFGIDAVIVETDSLVNENDKFKKIPNTNHSGSIGNYENKEKNLSSKPRIYIYQNYRRNFS